MVDMEKVIFEDIQGMTYQQAWDYQGVLHKELIRKKLLKNVPDQIIEKPPHHLLFVEHSPVFTLGKSGSTDHLLVSEQEMESAGIEFFKINRGGDITYHGPGQITGYPIFDLDRFFTDVHKYVRYLEEAVIMTLGDYGITGYRIPKYTGVWVGEDGNERKICAIGVHLSRWVTMHGFAFNVNTDLTYFDKIIPCGIQDDGLSVTSMKKELGRELQMDEVKSNLKRQIARIFNIEYI